MNGHIRKRRGRYYVELELDPTHDAVTGERERRRVGAGAYRTKREADDALRDALDRARRGWRGPSKLTLGDYLIDEWLPGVDMERAATTAALYRTVVTAYITPTMGSMMLEAISPADLTALYRDLLAAGGRNGRPLAPKTVRHVHTTLRKALGDAVEARHIAFNPAASAKAPKVARGAEPRVWTVEQLAAFLAGTEGERLRPLWIATATTGLRRSEALGLRWSDVDLENGTATVRQVFVAYGKLRVMKEPKTATSRRTLPLSDRVVAELRGARRRQAEERLAAGPAWSDSDLVFTDEIGRPLDPPSVSAAFKRAVKASGLPLLPLHGLRHTFATIGLDAGVDVLYVAEMLGHSSPAITMNVYQHVRRDRLSAAMAVISSALEGH